MLKQMTIWRNYWNSRVTKLWKEEDGIGTLEIILIIAVIIIIALLFKDWIIELVNNLMGQADSQANEIFS
ncbi:Flp1 family type IVb pilin [Paenibacillus kobensis]|uniref:Flp1 family type IVb pilin n=1 Tax=Paenibacillus kobensis TaxID=59841 RepID=UPI001FE251A2|nr:Flp1 family type IVb pilin [Paenibacillus kobensis]